MDEDRILTYCKVKNLHLQKTHSLLVRRNDSVRKSSYNKQNKSKVCEKDHRYALSCQKTIKTSRPVVRVATEVFIAKEILLLLALNAKRLAVKETTFPKRE